MRKLISAFLLSVCVVAMSGCAHKKVSSASGQTIDKEALRSVIRDSKKEFQRCYDTALKKNPNSAGKIEVQWDIDAGKVKNASVKKSTLNDSEFDMCIVQKVEKLKFQSPPKDQIARVVYPFVFAAK